MRRLILTLVLLAASAVVGLAQYATVIEEGPDHTYPAFAIAVANSFVNLDWFSVYVTDNAGRQRVKILQHQNFNTFALGTVTTLRQFDVQGTMVINDITTVGNLVVFCGRIYTTAQYGIVGYFDLSSIPFTTPSSVVLHWHTVQSVTELNKVVAHIVGGRHRVEAIGVDENSTAHPHYVVEVDDITATPVNVRHAQLPSTATHKELAHEIVLLQNRLMVVGYDGINSMPCYRLFDRTVGLPDPTFNTINHMLVSGTEVLSATHTTHMANNNVAMSYLSYGSGSYFSTRIRYLNPVAADNYRSEEIVPADKTEPRNIAYWLHGKTLVLAEPFVLSSGTPNHTDFVYLDPSATLPYLANVDYHDNDFFHVMTLIGNNRDAYLAVFGDRYMLRRIAASWPLQDANCPARKTVLVSPVDKFKIQHSFSSCTIAQPQHSSYTDTLSVQTPGVSTICTNY